MILTHPRQRESSPAMEAPPLRSLLFVPGDNRDRSMKAMKAGADAVIFDLEDAVAIERKPDARQTIRETLTIEADCQRFVRMNAVDTPFFLADLEATVAAKPDGIVVPKVESAAALYLVDRLIAALGDRSGVDTKALKIIPIIETAAGFVAIEEIAGFRQRIRCLSFGAGDLTRDIGARWTPDERELDTFRSILVAQSRAFGLEKPIDSVWIRLDDPEGLVRSATRVRDLGYQGKFVIHPGQVAPVQAVFSPNDAEIAEAKQIVDAFEAAEAAGKASIRVGNVFVDYPIYERARATLALVRRSS